MPMTWTGPLNPVSAAVHEIPADYTGQSGNLRMRVPGRIIAQPSLLPSIQEDNAPEQVANVATLPGIVGYAMAMPDIHWGYGFPIGGVAATRVSDGVVSPGGVGFDINCGVRLLRTSLRHADIEAKLGSLLDQIFRDVPAGAGRGTQAEMSKADQDGV